VQIGLATSVRQDNIGFFEEYGIIFWDVTP
jgi:hypothetical protein